MPIERHRISHSQLAECLGYEPSMLVAVQRVCSRDYTGWEVITEMQTTGTFPEVSDNKVRTPRKGGKKR